MTIIDASRKPFAPGYHDDLDDDFAIGAVRYLRANGLDAEAIRTSLVRELGLDPATAQRYVAAG